MTRTYTPEQKIARAAYMKRWFEANPGKMTEATIKRKKNGRGRESAFIYEFGINFEQRDQMLRHQGGVCAICSVSLGYILNEDGSVKPPFSRDLGLDKAHTDHCHTTGKVRGILCQRCNLILGHARDRIAVLKAAIAYLEKHLG
jgi:hypothetical protein